MRQLKVWHRSKIIMEEYIRVNIVPEIIKHYNECIEDYKLTKCEIIPLKSMVNWASFLYTLDLSVVIENDEVSLDRHYSLFVKCMMNTCKIRSFEVSKKQFSNEIHIYNTVQPIFKKLICQKDVKIFPEASYAMMKDIKLKKYTEPTDGIIILENLTKQGYKLSPQKFLDMDHCVLALEQLGRWHALSLLSKELNPEEFYGKILTGIQECIWDEENRVQNQHLFYPYLGKLFQNAEYMKDSKTSSALKILKEKWQNLPQYVAEIFESSRRSKLSVLCHGDYCRINILFKYTETGVPISAIPIDYQNVRYGSPALDISYFMYLNTKSEVRDTFFLASIEKYHASMVKTMKQVLVEETEKTSEEISAILPSLDSILEDFKQHGIYGMISGITAVPLLAASENEINNLISLLSDLESKKYHDAVMNFGGEVATNIVADMFHVAITSNQINI